MGFWIWLWERLNEPSTWDEEGQRPRDHCTPGGKERFFPNSLEQPCDRFRSSFGDHYGGGDEEDYDGDDGDDWGHGDLEISTVKGNINTGNLPAEPADNPKGGHGFTGIQSPVALGSYLT